MAVNPDHSGRTDTARAATDSAAEVDAPKVAENTAYAGWSRRVVLRGVAVAGTAVTVPIMAACGADDESDGGDGTGDAGENGDSEAGENGDGGDASGVLARTDEIEIGGGLVLEDEEVVITQPEEGSFRAFSNVCTHEGCSVGEVAEGTINCPCHGSMFNVADGSVESGPADEPLPGVEVMVDGNQIVRA